MISSAFRQNFFSSLFFAEEIPPEKKLNFNFSFKTISLFLKNVRKIFISFLLFFGLLYFISEVSV